MEGPLLRLVMSFRSVNKNSRHFCFWLVNFKESSPLKPLGQMNRNLVGSMHGGVSIKFAQILFFGWLISKNMFLSLTAYSQMNQNLVASIYGRSSKYCSFRQSPLTNMAATGNSCFWLVDF